MRRGHLFLLICVWFACAWTGSANAVPAWPHPVPTTQPDGTPVTVRLFGDEWYHYYESLEGFAIVQDEEGWWSYAALNAEGRYTSTTHRLGKTDPARTAFLAMIGAHLREAAAIRNERRERFRSQTMPSILERAAKLAKPGQTAVTISVPVVLIQYPDFFASQTAASFTDLMNQANYNGTGSFRDYYQQISYGNLTVNATVVGWYTAPNNRVFYKNGPGQPSNASVKPARQLVRSAVDLAEAGGTNWAPYDNDGDGLVDVVFVVHQGPGAECGNPAYIWSHAFYLNDGVDNFSVTYDTKLIDRYIIQPEISCTGGHIEIGVFCHEFGHVLGLPDLYDTDYSSAGIGNWDLMASGSYGGNGSTPEKPSHMSAWSKIELGWVAPTVVGTTTVGTSIPQVETSPTVFKLWTNGMPMNEYFLIENRQKTGFDVNLPTAGLAIWHVDATKADNRDEAHKLLDLEEADGLAQMDASSNNRGDAGDLYPGSTVNRNFDGGTNPNSNDYAGAATQVCVDNVSNSAATMTADFCVVPGPPPDLAIRDCVGDLGAEPDAPCATNWVQSPDIWVDNNDDGIIDAPIKGIVNHLYIRSWNRGGPATNASIKCWYVNPSLGLKFGMGSPGTQITDAVSFASSITIPTMNTAIPSAGGQGYRRYFNWLIPTPPPNIDHYCIGCVIENAQDPQTSPVPLNEDNLGQINYWALALKAGTQPALAAGEHAAWQNTSAVMTVFREDVRVYNREATSQAFKVRVEGLNNGFFALPDTAIILTLPAGGADTLTFDIVKSDAQHFDAGHVEFKLYKYPSMELTGALIHDLQIDNYQPAAPTGWTVRNYQFRGDNFTRPVPRYTISWFAPHFDINGYPETVRRYEIHASTDSSALLNPDSTTLVKVTGGDDDLQAAGYQFNYYTANTARMFFTVRAVDTANNPGVPTPPQAAPADNGTTAVEPPGSVAMGLQLYPNVPNPFGASTNIWFRIDRDQPVTVALYDLTGRLVRTLARSLLTAGLHRVEWDGRDEASRSVRAGIYVVKVQTTGEQVWRKIIRTK